MKTVSTKKNVGLLSIVLCLVFVSAFSSCKKEETISEEEASEIAEQSVSTKSGGISLQIEDAAELMAPVISLCGESFDTVITHTNLPGAAISYSINHTWSYDLVCSGIQPSLFNFTVDGSMSYDAPRMSSDDNMNLDFVVTGLQNASSSYLFNGTYTRNGSQQSKIRNKNAFSTTLVFTLNNVAVDKSTLKITGGSASVSIDAAVTGGAQTSFDGNLTFLGNSTATLTLNGNVYSIQW